MTNFWWVNQRETFAEERELGLLWAPLLSRASRRQSHWDSMDLVAEGDIVFHYAFGSIRGVSRVLLASRDAGRPFHREEWNEAGREVRVDFQEIEMPFYLDQIPRELRSTQTQPNAPFNAKGGVNQGYLWTVTRDFGTRLLSMLGVMATLADPEVSDEPENVDGSRRPFVFLLDQTDGEVLVRYRKEQPALRTFLFQGVEVATCDLCARELPVGMLVTAHIKPRSKCTDAERRDENIVFVACTIGCDSLFENGYVHVDATGVTRAGKASPFASDLRASVDALVGLKMGRFSEANARYFGWHRKQVAPAAEVLSC